MFSSSDEESRQSDSVAARAEGIVDVAPSPKRTTRRSHQAGRDPTSPSQQDAAAAWPGTLKHILEKIGVMPPGVEQARPLRIVDACCGLGSWQRMWRDTGVQCEVDAAAEPKPHAKKFLTRNDLTAKHHFDCISSLVDGGEAMCAIHGKVCDVPEERADMFAAGFACQPTSSMRACRKRVRPEEHESFAVARLVVAYVLRRKPRTALLEQTIGALSGDVYDNVAQSEVEWIRSQVECEYYFDWAKLDLKPWVKMRRPRVWMFLVSRQVSETNTATTAAQLALRIEAERRLHPPRSLRDFTYSPGHPLWDRVLLGCMCVPVRKHSSKGAWRSACEAMREQWRSREHPWADDHPLGDAQVRGCARTERVVEVLEVSLLRACEEEGLDPRRDDDLKHAMREVWCDASQNYGYVACEFGYASCACTSSRIYDYLQDRVLLPEELLRVMGWAGAEIEDIADSDLQNLVGECQALQPLAVASWALLRSVDGGLTGLWRPSGTGERDDRSRE